MTAILIVLGIILLICLANSGSEKPKKSKAEVRRELLWKMKHWQGQEELDDIFRFYNDHTDYDLKNYPPFKSWYKTHVDDWLKDGCIRLKGGGEYKPEEDPLYDPDAPDWYDTYDIRYIYDDEEEDDDDEDNDDCEEDDNDDDEDNDDFDEDDNDDDEEDVLAKLYERQKIDRMSLTERIDYEASKKRKFF